MFKGTKTKNSKRPVFCQVNLCGQVRQKFEKFKIGGEIRNS